MPGLPVSSIEDILEIVSIFLPVPKRAQIQETRELAGGRWLEVQVGGTKAEEVRDLRGRGDLPRFPSISLGHSYSLSILFLFLKCRVLYMLVV